MHNCCVHKFKIELIKDQAEYSNVFFAAYAAMPHSQYAIRLFICLFDFYFNALNAIRSLIL